jgi:uncharacterized protein
MTDMFPSPSDSRAGSGLDEQLAEYRRTREGIERQILPLGTAIDGLSFEFQASLHGLELRRGGYVVIESEGRSVLGQITDLAATSVNVGDGTAGTAGTQSTIRIQAAQGSGTLIAGDERPFHDGRIRPATSEEVAKQLSTPDPRRAGLTVGELLLAPGVPATLDSGGLNRHTFLCGQSGSGKTYSLGLLLERVLAETTLRVVILDPNSDYVGLPHLREGAEPELAARYARVPEEVAVWRNDPRAEHPLRLRFADLDSAAQAAVLELDPIRDRDEYAFLTELLRAQEDGKPLISGMHELPSSAAPGARELGLRAGNLGVLGWRVWSPDLPSVVDEMRTPTSRCTVIDLGSMDTMQEQQLVAQAVLATLWESRYARTPCLVVIDEAHNICPADPPGPLTRLSADQTVQIAAEGRKYGLYLLTSTQRPSKVHENVVSQCDNLLLMRMNSKADLADLSRLFSFVPEGLMAGATSFKMGQTLVAGKLMQQPAYVQMGQRVSEEGGGDIPATWAAPRA